MDPIDFHCIDKNSQNILQNSSSVFCIKKHEGGRDKKVGLHDWEKSNGEFSDKNRDCHLKCVLKHQFSCRAV